jgi:predicted MFS family arabinose efflux permease
MIASGLFFSGMVNASVLNYGGIVGIETLGIPNATYSLLLMVASLVGAAASVALGYVSDKVRDRRILVALTALMGALGYGLIFAFRSPIAFIIATCAVMPFGNALFSQSFSYARSYYNARDPARAEFMNSVLRTVFTVAWIIVPPLVGWFTAATTVFNAYGVASLAFAGCALVYCILLLNPDAKIGVPARAAGEPAVPLAKARIEPAILWGIIGVTFIFTAVAVRTVAVPLLITSTLKGSLGDLGIFAGLAAGIEAPFVILWGYALRWLSKHTIIIIASLIYAVYLVLLSRAGSVAEVLWLQLLNGPATSALLSIPISYLQDAIKGRVGLSTSLLDVTHVVSALASAAVFGALTAAAPNYPILMVAAAVLSLIGAAVLFAAHRIVPLEPATSR